MLSAKLKIKWFGKKKFIEIEQKSGRIYILIFIFRALDLTNSLKTFLLIALPAAVGIVAGLLTLETNNTREVSAGSSWLVLLKKPGDVLHCDRPGRGFVLLPVLRPGGLQPLHLFLTEEAVLGFNDICSIRQPGLGVYESKHKQLPGDLVSVP